ncbi:MAG: hypothetical protein ACYTAS_21690, partial [Planctomycetota bacterium]
MGDCAQLEQLIKAGYSCISIVTHEEQYALEVVCTAAVNLDRPLWIWSMGTGVRAGTLTACRPVAD